MRYTIGLVSCTAAAWLVAAALAHRRRFVAAGGGTRAIAARPVPPTRSLDAMGEIARPLILGALVYVGIKTAFVFYAFDAVQVLSVLDLAGFLVLLAGYGTWFVMKTKYRLSSIEHVPPAQAENDEAATADEPEDDRPAMVFDKAA